MPHLVRQTSDYYRADEGHTRGTLEAFEVLT